MNMYKRFLWYNAKLISTLALTLGLSITPAAMAQGKADFEQDIFIDSEEEWFDIQNRIAVFDKNAVITQGTLKITADHIEVAEQQGNRTFTATGTPATYQQQLDDGSMMQAEAETIFYDEQAQQLRMLGNVKVSQANKEISGAELVYDFATQQLRARRGDDENERVTTIFRTDSKNNDEPINR